MGVYLFLEFDFLSTLIFVTQDGEAVERGREKRLVWSIRPI